MRLDEPADGRGGSRGGGALVAAAGPLLGPGRGRGHPAHRTHHRPHHRHRAGPLHALLAGLQSARLHSSGRSSSAALRALYVNAVLHMVREDGNKVILDRRNPALRINTHPPKHTL